MTCFVLHLGRTAKKLVKIIIFIELFTDAVHSNTPQQTYEERNNYFISKLVSLGCCLHKNSWLYAAVVLPTNYSIFLMKTIGARTHAHRIPISFLSFSSLAQHFLDWFEFVRLEKAIRFSCFGHIHCLHGVARPIFICTYSRTVLYLCTHKKTKRIRTIKLCSLHEKCFHLFFFRAFFRFGLVRSTVFFLFLIFLRFIDCSLTKAKPKHTEIS